MDAPIYDDDLIILDPHYAAPLLRLRACARAAITALRASQCEYELDAALDELADVVWDVNDVFADEDAPALDTPLEVLDMDAWMGEKPWYFGNEDETSDDASSDGDDRCDEVDDWCFVNPVDVYFVVLNGLSFGSHRLRFKSPVQSPDGYTDHDSEVGAPLSEEAEAAYVAILADELALERAWKASIRKVVLDYTTHWWQCYYAGYF
ncbi:hypothetical protein SLS57_011341 [Botryosphaeria dothidea]